MRRARTIGRGQVTRQQAPGSLGKQGPHPQGHLSPPVLGTHPSIHLMFLLKVVFVEDELVTSMEPADDVCARFPGTGFREGGRLSALET